MSIHRGNTLMKNLNLTAKTLPLAIILFSFSTQAEPLVSKELSTYSKSACWSAGIIDGLCYQTSEQGLVSDKQELSITKYSSSGCWTAGGFNGMCYHEKSTTKNKEPKPTNSTTFSARCWTAGVLGNMCF